MYGFFTTRKKKKVVQMLMELFLVDNGKSPEDIYLLII